MQYVETFDADALRALGHARADAVLAEVPYGTRRGHVAIEGLAVVILALGAIGGLVAALEASGHPPASRIFALSGPGNAHVRVQLASESWGTSIQLIASGQKGGQMLTVSMRTEDGSWWEAGTYTTVSDGRVDVTMGCGLPESTIEAVRITNSNGQQILSSNTYS